VGGDPSGVRVRRAPGGSRRSPNTRSHARFGRWAEENATPSTTPASLAPGIYDHCHSRGGSLALSRSESRPHTRRTSPKSPGTLQTIFEYQSMICELTGMESRTPACTTGDRVRGGGAPRRGSDGAARPARVLGRASHYSEVDPHLRLGRSFEVREVPLERGATAMRRSSGALARGGRVPLGAAELRGGRGGRGRAHEAAPGRRRVFHSPRPTRSRWRC